MSKTAVDKMVHDSRACLNSITMNAELVKLLVTQNADPERTAQLMDTIIKQCRQCDTVLENFRTVEPE